MGQAATYNELQVEITNRQILKIALPISFAILVPQLNFIINNIFLGHYPDGGKSLAVAGITGVYYLIFSAIGFGLNNGLQALIARRAGENRPEEIGKIFNQGVLIAMIIAAIGIITTWLFTPYIFSLFIGDEGRLKQAIEFSRIRILGLPFLYVYQMRNALLVGTNQSKYLVIGTLAEAAANILFDYLLIFGRLGLPRMGLNGAAIASIIAEFVGMFVIFLVIHVKGIAKRFQLFGDLRWNKKNANLILSMSAPLVFQTAISLISWEYFFLLIDKHGEVSLAVSNAMRNVFGIFGMISWAFAATTNAMVSNIIGQGKYDLMNTLLIRIIRMSTGFSLIVAVILNLFPEQILSIYGQPQAFIDVALPVIRVVSSALVLMSFSVICLNAVTGTGNTKVTLGIEFITIVFYAIYVYLVLDRFFLSITYGWMSEWLYWTCLFVPSYLYLRSGKWKNKVI